MRTFLAIVVGIVLGGLVNAGLIQLSGSIIPLPEGVDPSDMESLEANMHLFEPKHFLMPFLAHALGTLVGAFAAASIARERRAMAAGIIGGFYLLGGIAAASMLPAPTWFLVVDLVGAYLPMAWLAARIVGAKAAPGQPATG